MLTLSAQPRNAISSPANGSTGQKPRLAITPATAKDTKHRLLKNSTAARRLSEQWGQISMRCGSGCTDEWPWVFSAVLSRWYCAKFFIQVRSLGQKVHVRAVRRRGPAPVHPAQRETPPAAHLPICA